LGSLRDTEVRARAGCASSEVRGRFEVDGRSLPIGCVRRARARSRGGGGFIPGESVGRVGFEPLESRRLPGWRPVGCASASGVLRASACASAHRPATARGSPGLSGEAWALRADFAPPVRPSGACSIQRRMNAAAKSSQTRRPDASLEVSGPFSACRSRRDWAARCHSRCVSRSDVGLTSPPPSPLVPARSALPAMPCVCGILDATRGAPCTHAPATSCSSLRFSFAGRSWPGRLCADRRHAF